MITIKTMVLDDVDVTVTKMKLKIMQYQFLEKLTMKIWENGSDKPLSAKTWNGLIANSIPICYLFINYIF